MPSRCILSYPPNRLDEETTAVPWEERNLGLLSLLATNLPRLGRVVLGRKARRFAAGLYEYEGTYLYVNKGVGFGWRLRYNVRPEVAVFTLRPA